MTKLFILSAVVLAIYQSASVWLAGNVVATCAASSVALFCK